MAEPKHSREQWFTEVIAPSLDILRSMTEASLWDESLDIPAVLNALLRDLEMIELDNFTVEFYVERILDAVRVSKMAALRPLRAELKPLALIALSRSWERPFYLTYWRVYRPLRSQHPEIKDQSLLNIYSFQSHLGGLANYLQNVGTKLAEVEGAATKATRSP